jgi:hypothetical protein
MEHDWPDRGVRAGVPAAGGRRRRGTGGTQHGSCRDSRVAALARGKVPGWHPRASRPAAKSTTRCSIRSLARFANCAARLGQGPGAGPWPAPLAAGPAAKPAVRRSIGSLSRFTNRAIRPGTGPWPAPPGGPSCRQVHHAAFYRVFVEIHELRHSPGDRCMAGIRGGRSCRQAHRAAFYRVFVEIHELRHSPGDRCMAGIRGGRSCRQARRAAFYRVFVEFHESCHSASGTGPWLASPASRPAANPAGDHRDDASIRRQSRHPPSGVARCSEQARIPPRRRGGRGEAGIVGAARGRPFSHRATLINSFSVFSVPPRWNPCLPVCLRWSARPPDIPSPERLRRRPRLSSGETRGSRCCMGRRPGDAITASEKRRGAGARAANGRISDPGQEVS